LKLPQEAYRLGSTVPVAAASRGTAAKTPCAATGAAARIGRVRIWRDRQGGRSRTVQAGWTALLRPRRFRVRALRLGPVGDLGQTTGAFWSSSPAVPDRSEPVGLVCIFLRAACSMSAVRR